MSFFKGLTSITSSPFTLVRKTAESVRNVADNKTQLIITTQEKSKPSEYREEIWKPIRGHEEKYEISSLGRVRNYRGYIRSIQYVGKGIPAIQLHWEGKKITKTISSLLHENFNTRYSAREIKRFLRPLWESQSKQ